MDLITYLNSPGAMSVAELARAAGIRHTAQITQWKTCTNDRRPGDVHAAAIEWATKGLCTCEELNPNLSWRRLPDAEWPWHPDGRPVVDPTMTLECASVATSEAAQC